MALNLTYSLKSIIRFLGIIKDIHSANGSAVWSPVLTSKHISKSLKLNSAQCHANVNTEAMCRNCLISE